MSAVLAAVAFAAEKKEFDPNQVSPGFAGFLVVALLGVAVLLLGLNLVRRLRRNKYRAEIRAELEAELAGGDAPAGAEPSGWSDAGDEGDAPGDAGDADGAAR